MKYLISTDGKTVNGWCDAHQGVGDHTLADTCVNPVTEAQFMADLEAANREWQARAAFSYSSRVSTPEAEYVSQHRPY